MRIALVTREYPPDTAWGGIGSFYAHLARAIAGLGHDVEVFCQSLSTARTEVADGVTVHHVLVRPNGQAVAPADPLAGLTDLGAFAQALAEAMLTAVRTRHAEAPFDIVEGHEHLGITALIAEAGLPGARTIARYHTAYHSLVARGLVDWPESETIRDLEHRAIHRSDFRITTSRFVDEITRQDFDAPYADAEIFNFVAETAPLPDPPPREELFAFVGRMVLGHKRPDLAAIAFSRLAERFPETRLEFAGPDMTHQGGASVWALCEDLVPPPQRHRVKYHGVLSPDDVRRLYRRAKILIAPSAFESFGMVALEAMREGCVPVVSDRTALAEVVADPALTFRNGDAASLTEVLARLASDPALLAAKAESCKRRAAELTYKLAEKNAEAFTRFVTAASTHAAPPSCDLANDPLISVVVPSYNQGPYIEETIRSILEQDYPNIEVIVCDGGSNDSTVDVLKKFGNAIRWVSEKDKGQTHAINKGILASHGRIVAYLNSDDVYRPGALRTIADYFFANPDAKIIVGNCDYIDQHSKTIGHIKARCDSVQDLVRYWGWDKWFAVPQQATFWRRSLMSEIGLFNTDLHMVMDFEYWLRVAQVTKFGTINRTLAAFRLVEGTKTVSRTHEMYREEFETFQRFKYVLPQRDRARVTREAKRHYAKKLIMMAQHYLLTANARRLSARLIWTAIKTWPLYALRPEVILCSGHLALSVIAPPQRLERMHRFGLRIAPVWRN
jgi:glycosyltransferase involved in cell wall biosynthesis